MNDVVDMPSSRGAFFVLCWGDSIGGLSACRPDFVFAYQKRRSREKTRFGGFGFYPKIASVSLSLT